MDFTAFRVDEKTNFAVVRCLEIIGEASKRIPEQIRARYPAIPWIAMAGMRDKSTHDYFGVDLEVVWHTVAVELPPLIVAMESVLADEIS